MAITYQQVQAWLKQQCHEESACTVQELEALEELASTAVVIASERQEKMKKAIAEVEQVARTYGVPADSLLASVTGQPGLTASRPRGRPRKHEAKPAVPRRPYLIPDDPNTEAYAIHSSQGRAWPEAVVAFLEANPEWDKEDLHYKRIAKKWAQLQRRGIQVTNPWAPLTPEQKHSQLMLELAGKGELRQSRAKG
jgi:DNA-binding protein H-NS